MKTRKRKAADQQIINNKRNLKRKRRTKGRQNTMDITDDFPNEKDLNQSEEVENTEEDSRSYSKETLSILKTHLPMDMSAEVRRKRNVDFFGVIPDAITVVEMYPDLTFVLEPGSCPADTYLHVTRSTWQRHLQPNRIPVKVTLRGNGHVTFNVQFGKVEHTNCCQSSWNGDVSLEQDHFQQFLQRLSVHSGQFYCPGVTEGEVTCLVPEYIKVNPKRHKIPYQRLSADDCLLYFAEKHTLSFQGRQSGFLRCKKCRWLVNRYATINEELFKTQKIKKKGKLSSFSKLPMRNVDETKCLRFVKGKGVVSNRLVSAAALSGFPIKKPQSEKTETLKPQTKVEPDRSVNGAINKSKKKATNNNNNNNNDNRNIGVMKRVIVVDCRVNSIAMAEILDDD